jgi:ribosomal protein L37AE/L43A
MMKNKRSVGMKPNIIRESGLFYVPSPKFPELECPGCHQSFPYGEPLSAGRKIISCPNCGLTGEENAFYPELELQKMLALARSKMELVCAREKKRG